MLRAHVNPSYICNNHCRFCPHGDKRDELPPLDTDGARALLNEARQRSDRLVLTGGEPSIRPDFTELLEYAKSLRFKEIMVETNGRMFAYAPFAAKCAKLQITAYIVAVQGHTPELHDFLTRTEGSFKQTLAGIRNLKLLRQQVYTSTVITRSNYRHLNAILSVVAKLKVDAASYSFVHAEGYVLADTVRLMPRLALVDPYLRESFKLARKEGIAFSVEGVPPCFLIGMQKFMRETPESGLVWLDQQGVQVRDHAWRVEQERTFGPVCDVCEAKPRCEGALKAYINEYGWGEFEPIGGSAEGLHRGAIPPGGEFVHEKPVEK